MNFFSYVKAKRLSSFKFVYPVIFSFKSEVNVVKFEMFNDLNGHVMYFVFFGIKVFAYGVEHVFIVDVKSVITESGLQVMFGLTDILHFTLFTCYKIDNVVTITIGGVMALKDLISLRRGEFVNFVYVCAHFASGFIALICTTFHRCGRFNFREGGFHQVIFKVFAFFPSSNRSFRDNGFHKR